MTMRVTIKNEDTHRTARVKTIDHPGDDLNRKVSDVGDLKPGESRDFWIHSTRHLIVEELNSDG